MEIEHKEVDNIKKKKLKINEIEILKKEIDELKIKNSEYEKKLEESNKYYTNEINLLKQQIKVLLSKFENSKGINKIISNDNDNIIHEKEIDKKYSIECLTQNLKTEILQGSEKASIKLKIKNNSLEELPENTYLICDKKYSLLLCDNVEISKLEPNAEKIVTIQFRNLKYISVGEYKSIIKLKVDNKIYDSQKIELIIEIKKIPKNENDISYEDNMKIEDYQGQKKDDGITLAIQAFRNQFNLYGDNISNEMIENALKISNMDFNNAFGMLFQ
jgi:hypothetical protein